MFGVGLGDRAQSDGPTEAPTGFDGASNGFAEEFCANQDALTNSPNSPQIPDDECNFDAALEEFIGPETVADGLGPIFNASGCGECHIGNPGNADDGTPLLGATSQVTEKRAGFFNGTVFTPHPGGSLIQDRALNPSDQELVFPSVTNVIALRSTLSVLGDGFVEAIGNNTLQDIANDQPSSKRGQLINVPVLEKPGTTRVGRFGHKDQQASLVSFSADAYVNEMGITSPLQPDENTSNGRTVPGSGSGSGRRGRGRRAVRALHAVDQGAAARPRPRRTARMRRRAATSSTTSAATRATRGPS